jgi:hypothetical protein
MFKHVAVALVRIQARTPAILISSARDNFAELNTRAAQLEGPVRRLCWCIDRISTDVTQGLCSALHFLGFNENR